MKRIALPHIAVSVVVVDPLFFYLLFAISFFLFIIFFFVSTYRRL